MSAPDKPASTREETAQQLRELGVKPLSDSRLTDEEKERRSQAFLDSQLGEGDEVVYSILLKILHGELPMEAYTRLGDPITKHPSYSDRMEAARILLDRHRGRPVQKHQHDLKPPADRKWNPDNLELDDIKTMRQLAEKATVVDAEFTETKDTKK